MTRVWKSEKFGPGVPRPSFLDFWKNWKRVVGGGFFLLLKMLGKFDRRVRKFGNYFRGKFQFLVSGVKRRKFWFLGNFFGKNRILIREKIFKILINFKRDLKFEHLGQIEKIE